MLARTRGYLVIATVTLLSPYACGVVEGGDGAEEFAPEKASNVADPARIVFVDERARLGANRVMAEAEIAEEGRHLLVSSTGLAFHRTSRAVKDLRTLGIGGGTELYLWEELEGSGERIAFSAYSKGGKEALGRVQETTYVIRLDGKEFDPLRGDRPNVRLLAASDNNLQLVQFLATPLPEFRQEIMALGGKVLRFLSDHTFLVQMPKDIRSKVAALPYVRWVGPYHPEYKVEAPLKKAIVDGQSRLEWQRYSIMLGEEGSQNQEALAARITKMGGHVVLTEPGGLRMEAMLSQEQVAALSRDNAIQFIDRWGGPGEMDMDIVRKIGGANAIETLKGWTGQGVRGEIFDTELLVTHREWATPPIVHSTSATSTSYHGTSCYSNNFAKGVNPEARGMIPSGQGIFFLYSQSTQFGGTKSRYDANRELIDPAGRYKAVFQTSSVGSALTTSYTTVSAEVDDYLFKAPILSTQSQSNAGSTSSRPQAWAKNIVSVGAFRHGNTETRTDDTWNRSGSTGPAADGRIKPDLSYFFDSITSATGSSTSGYTQFGGTSSATPQTAGHFGLLFQMWHNKVWAGFGGKADVFSSRPQMATAKALMINMAHRYNWKAGGANADLDRPKQGWGTADVKRLYDRASVTSVIDETDVLTPLGKKTYNVAVVAGQTELNVTMVYKDPMGTVGATRARVNDLSLKVTSPSGQIYWGNNGLSADNFSTSGGTANKVDTVENVFLKNPQAGTWKVEVLGDEIVQDGNPQTPAIDAVYGLVVSGGRIST